MSVFWAKIVPGKIAANKAKVAKFILDNSELFATLKNTQIASILNLTPETLSRTLGKFKSSGFIEQEEKNHLTILDKDALEAIL